MKKSPKISIIIPVYNGSEYVEEAIESALKQTYSNIEILVVNDGSNDNGATRKIISKYLDKVKYFEKENGGVSTALNLAIDKMSGDYFSWLSHDDRYYENKIESQVEFLRNYDKKTIVYSDYDLMDGYSTVFATSKKNNKELTEKMEYCLYRGAINGITLLIPREAFEDYGKFDENLRCTQDYDMWFKMMKTYKFVHQPLVVATTRLHQLQTGNTSPRVLEEGNALWNMMIDELSEADMIRLEGSSYKFYKEMLNFMLTTPYTGTIKHLEDIIKKYEEDILEKMKKIKVSIIIPFYNRLEKLKQALDSAINQDHKNIEILLINDGTRDVTEIQEYISNFKEVKMIDNKINQGVSFARNIGIDKATGEYIAFLDSDDIFLPNKISKQLFLMLLNNIEFSYTSYIRKSESSEEIINCKRTGDVKKTLLYNCNIATPTVMISKELINGYDLKYDINLKYGEDVCFYLDIIKYAEPVCFEVPLTIVNVNAESGYINKNKQLEGIKNIITYLLNNQEYKDNDLEISYLFSAFVDLINIPNTIFVNVENSKVQSTSTTIRHSSRIKKTLKKGLNVIKKEGLIVFFKKSFKKILKFY